MTEIPPRHTPPRIAPDLIITPSDAVQALMAQIQAPDHEWFALLGFDAAHTPLAPRLVYSGTHCPIPSSIDSRAEAEGLATAGAVDVVSVRYHPHPWLSPMPTQHPAWSAIRHQLERARLTHVEHIVCDRDGRVVPFFFQAPDKPLLFWC